MWESCKVRAEGSVFRRRCACGQSLKLDISAATAREGTAIGDGPTPAWYFEPALRRSLSNVGLGAGLVASSIVDDARRCCRSDSDLRRARFTSLRQLHNLNVFEVLQWRNG